MKRNILGAPALAAIAAIGVARAESDANRFERPGVTADRATRTVRIEARATGVQKGTQTEFILIGPKSAHDYEAAAVSKAQPSDVHAALEFIGLKRGRPVEPASLRFWPRGERIDAAIEWEVAGADGKKETRRIRAEETILDRRTGKTMPAEGFVFVGSFAFRNDQGEEVYAADVEDPMSVLSAFNLRATVLDIPRLGTQDELYDHQLINPDLDWKAGQPLTFVLRPARPEGPPFERDVKLTLRVGEGGRPVGSLSGEDCPNESFNDVEPLARRLAELAKDGRDVYLTTDFDHALTLPALKAGAEWVQSLSDSKRARIEPPPDGGLFHRAFLPNEAFRDRARRPAQPWELHLRRVEKGVEGTLVRVTPRFGSDPPEFEETRWDIPTPNALRAALDEHGPGLAVLLVFAPGDLSYGELRSFVAPAMSTHPIVYFFAE